MDNHQSEILLPVGLNLDNHPSKQPENTSRFLLNVDVDPNNTSSLPEERGNYAAITFPGNQVGKIYLNRKEAVVFTDDGSINFINSVAETIETLVTIPEFNFTTAFPITGDFKLIKGCERTVHWQDHNNIDRWFNLDAQEDFKTNGSFDINLFSLYPEVINETVDVTVNSSGGNLEYGSYSFVLEYLDGNDNVIYRSIPTKSVYILDQNDATNTTGATNIEISTAEEGGKPLSNKSITLTVSNADTSYENLRIGVIYYKTADGITPSSHIINTLIPLDRDTITYTYSGINTSNGDFEVDWRTLVIPDAPYEVALVSEEVQGQRLRANLKQSAKDYSEFQKFASKIGTSYFTTLEEINSVDRTNSKNSVYNSSIPRDETVALSIRYKHRDGRWSPYFHIPGRVINRGIDENGDIVSLANAENSQYDWNLWFSAVYTLEEYNNLEPRLTRKYRIENTATKLTVNGDGTTYGAMGYHEVKQGTYVNPDPSCLDDYWGVDYFGNEIEGEYIRHHKVPDLWNEPLTTDYLGEDNEYSYRPLHIDFHNVEYPSDDIVDHEFGINVYDPNTSTVVDNGLALINTDYDNDRMDLSYNTNGNNFITNISPIFISNVNQSFLNVINPKFLVDKQATNYDYIQINNYYTVDNFYEYQVQDKRNFANSIRVDSQIALAKTLYNPIGINRFFKKEFNIVLNKNTKLEFNGYEIDGTKEDYQDLQIAKFDTDPSNFDFKDFNQDRETILSVTLKKDIDVLNNLNAISYIPLVTDSGNKTVTGSEVYISTLHYAHGEIQEDLLGNSADYAISGMYFRLPVESYYNLAVLSDSNATPNAYVYDVLDYTREDFTENEGIRINDWYLDYVGDDDNNVLIVDNDTVNNTSIKWLYNKDYSKRYPLALKGISTRYSFCSKCLNEYPVRIIFSENSFEEDFVDNYRVYKPNNYIDLPADTGSIQGMDYKDGVLIVRTEESCYILSPNPQTLQAEDTNIIIGTGDFLSIPPYELNVTHLGYGGQQHVLESINTDNGLFWVDRERGKVINYNKQIDEVSNKGMYGWFFDNLNKEDHCVLGYDPRNSRLLLTLKNNWTLSYLPTWGIWRSWHSYIPNHYISNPNTFLTEYEGKLYKHSSDNYSQFYGFDFDHIVEFTLTAIKAFSLSSFYYYAKAYLGKIENLDITFDGVLVYNENQSTGKNILALLKDTPSNIYYTVDTLFVQLVNKIYKVSPFRDMAVNNDIFIEDTSSIKQGVGQGYIDKLPHPTNVDSNKPMVRQGRFRDNWISVRLFKNSNKNYRLVTNFIQTLKHYVLR